MRARFLSSFEYLGDQVFCYLDLDTDETVWLKGGRGGEEIRRFPKREFNGKMYGRAIDFAPQTQLFDFIKRYSGIRKPFERGSEHIHYTSKTED